MQHIKNFNDVRKLLEQRLDGRLVGLVCTRMGEVASAFRQAGVAWDPEEHGHFCLIEEEDDVIDMSVVGLDPENGGLVGAIKEVVYWHPGARCWEVVVLYGGDSGMTFFCPDEPWLDPELRSALEADAVLERVTPPGGPWGDSPF